MVMTRQWWSIIPCAEWTLRIAVQPARQSDSRSRLARIPVNEGPPVVAGPQSARAVPSSTT